MSLRSSSARLFALLLAASLFFSACQSGPLPDQPETPLPTRSVTTQPTASAHTPASPTLAYTATPTEVPEHMQVDPAALKGLQITLWHPWSGEAEKLVDALVGEFNRDNLWGVLATARSTGSSRELYWQVADARADNSAPEVVAAPPDLLRYWDTRDAVANLADYAANPEWGMSAGEEADYYPVFWQQDQADGKQLGIPAERTVRVLFYNQSWARDLGFQNPPATLDDFRQQACRAAQELAQDNDRENNGLGGWIIDRDAYTMISWMAAFGGSPAGEAGALALDTSANREAFQYLRELYDTGCAWIARDPLPYEYFATRRALFYSGSPQQMTAQARAMERAANPDEWLLIPFPSQDSGQRLMASGVSYGVLRSTPERQLAGWLLVRYLSLPRNQARLAQANLSLPPSQGARQALAQFTRENSRWSALVEAVPGRMTAAQVSPEWWAASGVLEDATWQLYQLTPLPPSTILQQSETIVPEMMEHLP